jgi:hypothetical protein
MSRWLRINEDCIDNPKILKLPADLRWQWVALLCVASKNDGILPPIDDVALCLRVPEAKAAEYITKLVKAKLIDSVGDDFVPHNWDKRQFKSDSSTDRVKRFRDKKRNVSSSVSETVTETAPEQSRADTEQSRADASAPGDEELKKREAGLRAGISALFASRNQPTPENMDRCRLWLAQGCAAGTVLAAVETVLKRGRAVSTLEYFDGAIRDAQAKAVPPADLQLVSMQEFIIEGTLEWACWERYLRETTGRGSPVTDNRDEAGRLRRGWFRPAKVPEGYDEATGERIAPQSEDAA